MIIFSQTLSVYSKTHHKNGNKVGLLTLTPTQWRFLCFVALANLEAFILTRPYTLFSTIPLPFGIQPLLPFEQLILARKLALTIFIALSQIGPYLSPDPTPTNPSTAAELTATLTPHLERLEALTSVLEQQTGQAMATEFMPMQGDEEAVTQLEKKVKEHLLESQLRADPGVRDAVAGAIRRIRREV